MVVRPEKAMRVKLGGESVKDLGGGRPLLTVFMGVSAQSMVEAYSEKVPWSVLARYLSGHILYASHKPPSRAGAVFAMFSALSEKDASI